MLPDEFLDIFCTKYAKHLNSLHRKENAYQISLQNKVKTLETQRENLIQTIKDGIPAHAIKGDLEQVKTKLEHINTSFNIKAAPKPAIHPSMARRYRQSVRALRTLFNKKESHSEAAEHLRALVEKIVLTPRDGKGKRGGFED